MSAAFRSPWGDEFVAALLKILNCPPHVKALDVRVRLDEPVVVTVTYYPEKDDGTIDHFRQVCATYQLVPKAEAEAKP